MIKCSSQLQSFFEPKAILSLFNKPFNGLGLEEFVGNIEVIGSIPINGSMKRAELVFKIGHPSSVGRARLS